MSCAIINKYGKNGSEISMLGSSLLDIYNQDLEKATEEYAYFNSKEFIDRFGNWKKINYYDIKPAKGKRSDRNRVYPNGEPRILKNSQGMYYWIDNSFTKVFLENEPFERLGIDGDKVNAVEEVTNQIAFYIYNKYFEKDLSNLSSVSISIKDEIKNYFEDTKLENEEYTEAIEYLYEPYLTDWASSVSDFFKERGIYYIEETEEQSSEGAVKQPASFYRDQKESASINTKLALSFLTRLDSKGNPEVGDYIPGNKLMNYNEVYNELQGLLSDIPSIKVDGQATNILDEMVKRILNRAVNKPYLSELLDILNSQEDDYKRIEFAQAFNLVRNAVSVSQFEGGEGNRVFKYFNGSESSTKPSQLIKEWNKEFKSLFISQNLDETFEVDVDLISSIYNTHMPKLRTQASAYKKSREEADLESFRQEYTTFLNKIGINIEYAGVKHLFNGDNLSAEIYPAAVKEINAQLNGMIKFFGKTFNEKIFAASILSKQNTYRPPFKSQSSFKSIAVSQSLFENDYTDHTAIIGNKQLWLNSLPTHIQNKIDIWKFNADELQILGNMPGNKRSAWIHYLRGANSSTDKTNPELAAQRMKTLKLELRGVIQEEGKSREGTDNKTSKKGDFIINDFNQVLKGTLNNKGEFKHKPSYITPTPADKGREYIISLDYFLNTNATYDQDNKSLSFTGINYFTGVFTDEYARSIEVWEAIKNAESNNDYTSLRLNMHTDARGNLVEAVYNNGEKQRFKTREEAYQTELGNPKVVKYVGNGLRSFLFESLNNLEVNKGTLWNEDNSPIFNASSYSGRLTTTQLATVLPVIEEAISNRVISYLRKMEKFNLIKSTTVEGKRTYENVNIDSTTWMAYDGDIVAMTSDYVINSLISRIEYTKLFTGDMANYKSTTDYFKRIPETYIDGVQPILGLEKNDHIFKVAVINTQTFASANLDSLPTHLRKYYSRVDQNDAQAYITPKRWKFLMKRLAKWSDAKEKVFNKMINTPHQELSLEETRLVQAQPMKGVYYSLINGNPVYLKYSQAVLMPSMIAGSELEGMLELMEKNGTDEIVAVTGIKVGATIPNNILNEEGRVNTGVVLNQLTLDNRHWRLQQDLPTKGIHDTLIGSQIQKNIMDTLAFNINDSLYEDSKETKLDILKEIIGVTSYLSEVGMQKLHSEFGIKNLTDEEGNVIGTDYKIEHIEKLYKSVIQDLIDKKGPKNIINALGKELTPYSIPQSKDKIIQTIFSVIRKNAVKIKSDGGGFIQMSNHLLDLKTAKRSGVYMLKEDYEGSLKMPTLYTDVDGNKRVKPGQIFLPHSAIAELIPNYREMDLKEFNKIVSKELFNIVGYRIPNQALASSDALEVVGILPPGMGDMVVTYGEITAKTGSDFDIDKLYIMTPSFEVEYSKNTYKTAKEFLKNNSNATTKDELLDYYADVLDEEFPMSAEEFREDTILGIAGILDDLAKGAPLPNQLKEATKEVIKKVIFNPETRLGKEYIKAYDITGAVKNIKYVEYNQELPPDGNTANANKNRLIELYRKILLAPVRYNDLMSPIDYAFFEDEVIRVNGEDQATKDLEFFDPIYNIDMKYNLQAGQSGIGQMSNALVDHVRGQLAELKINKNYGWGNIDEFGNTLLDREYSESIEGLPKGEESFKISASLSSLINAFVDIANKNAFITKANWGTLMNNLGTFMLRTGVHPYKVIAFIKQPIITELVKDTQLAEGKLANRENKDIIGKISDKYETNYKEALVVQYGKEEGERVFNASMKSLTRKNLSSLSLMKMRRDISNTSAEKDSYYYFNQLVVLNNYVKMIPIVKKYRLNVVTSKFGETGAGINNTQTFILENQISDVLTPLLDNTRIVNYEKKFTDDLIGETFLGTYYKNTLVFINNLIEANPNLFLTGSSYSKDLFNDIARNSHKKREYLDDETLGINLDNELYSYYMSNFHNFNEGNIGMKEKFRNLKLTSENFLVKEIKMNTISGLTFLGIDNTRKKPTTYKNKLTDSWRDLFKTEPEIAEYLVRASYLQSGFKNNPFQMYEYIPNEWFIKNGANEYINSIHKDTYSFSTFKDQLYRHASNNRMIVPTTKEGKTQKGVYLALPYKSELFIGEKENKDRIFPRFITKSGSLFELIGYEIEPSSKGTFYGPRYMKTFKLGLSEAEAYLTEYNYDTPVTKSLIKDNNLTARNKENIKAKMEEIDKLEESGEFIKIKDAAEFNLTLLPAPQITIEDAIKQAEELKEIERVIELNSGETIIEPETVKPFTANEKREVNIYAKDNQNSHLSNFAERPFIAYSSEEDHFATVEGAFQAAKMLYSSRYYKNGYTKGDGYTKEGSSLLYKLTKAKGSKAKFLGSKRNLILTPEEAARWDKDSSLVMKGLLRDSFEQNAAALNSLLATNGYKLTHTQDTTKWKTEFPKLLMEIRDEFSETIVDLIDPNQLDLFNQKLEEGEITEEDCG